MRQLSILLLALLAGCMVGPDYERPEAIQSPAFKELDGWKPATPRDLADRGNWWELFDDPLLNRLESQVEVSNQTLRAAVAAYDQSVAIVAETRAQLFPTLGVGPSVTRSRSGSSGTGGTTASRTRNTFSLEATADWELDVWGRIRRMVQGDVAAAEASAADVANARLSAQNQLAVDYFQLRAADEQKALFDRTITDYQRAVTIATNQYNAGTVARSDLITAQAQLQGAVAASINTGVVRAQLEHAIAVLTGHPPSELTIPPGTLATAVPVVPTGLPSELLERRPDIAAAERTMAQQNAQIGVAVAAYYPTITLSGLFGFSGSQIGTLFSTANQVWSLGAAASQTIFDGGLRSATVTAARAGYDQAVANYRQTVLTAFQSVEDELSNLKILEQQYAAEEEAVRLARNALEVSLNQYRAGTQSYTTVITAQNTLLTDEQNRLAVQQQRMVASVNLIKALGGGWSARDLPQVSGAAF